MKNQVNIRRQTITCIGIANEAEQYLRDNEWYTCENYDDEYLEWFDDTYTTPSGEEVVAFGLYGYDG